MTVSGTHGFTREALARSVLDLPPPEAHSQPLSDSAVSALFGSGDLARKTLIRAWLDDGIRHIQSQPTGLTLRGVLRARLEYNEPVLQHLPEAFALLASPTYGVPLLDPRPAIEHAFKIADEACHVTGDASLQLAWYARRGSLAAIYTASELHQLTSPKTAYDFLDSLLNGSSVVKSSLNESSHLPAPGFEPNFSSDYVVVLDHSLADVFTVIGTSAGHERVTRLSEMCSGFELLDADTVAIDQAFSLKDVSVRTAFSAGNEDTSMPRLLPRQFFSLQETVPMIFGFLKARVSLVGTLTWDEESKIALYESKTKSGLEVLVWKLRVFEKLEENKTKVTETIRGKCPVWVKSTVQSQTRSGHTTLGRTGHVWSTSHSPSSCQAVNGASILPLGPAYTLSGWETFCISHDRYLRMDLKPGTNDKGSAQTTSSPDVSSEVRYDNVPPPSGVVFEEYLHYAAIQRRFEDGHLETNTQEKKSWMSKFSKDVNISVNVRDANEHSVIEDSERINAFRAMRTASWASVFYLITTDILGPFNAPFAISQVGWVPGVILYFVMGLAALYCGLILWRLFIRLDSPQYPLKTYADIAERLLGRNARHSIQLVVNVGTICLGNGQALSQMSKNRVFWALAGMFIGQIRTLKSYGWLANSAVWINLLIIFISMGVVAHSLPNFESAMRSFGTPEGPVETHSFVPLPLFNKVNGIMNMVFAYGGAMIFPEMMAEMRRPMDFWKGMVMAQALIFSAYLLYGAFVYAFQGQFTLPLAFQGVSVFAWQTVCNALALVTGLIAAGLYGNIGIS
ncbi:hypothetical protein C0995_000026 [Termitomyces sp. Mi166|nr:hypothetical protein C0995_000026 [Termitomyces sp. Mi166\